MESHDTLSVIGRSEEVVLPVSCCSVECHDTLSVMGRSEEVVLPNIKAVALLCGVPRHSVIGRSEEVEVPNI